MAGVVRLRVVVAAAVGALPVAVVAVEVLSRRLMAWVQASAPAYSAALGAWELAGVWHLQYEQGLLGGCCQPRRLVVSPCKQQAATPSYATGMQVWAVV